MTRLRAVAVVVALLFLVPPPAEAYSVLAHESNIDALWEAQIRPLLLAKYPGTSAQALLDARAYAYGGSVVQDLGYYPFGSHFFTNLVHYVKSGDFVERMLRDAADVNDYAFAIGALCHYASDNAGHAIAVNKAVPLIYRSCGRSSATPCLTTRRRSTTSSSSSRSTSCWWRTAATSCRHITTSSASRSPSRCSSAPSVKPTAWR
jgi:hypothetical protein